MEYISLKPGLIFNREPWLHCRGVAFTVVGWLFRVVFRSVSNVHLSSFPFLRFSYVVNALIQYPYHLKLLNAHLWQVTSFTVFQVFNINLKVCMKCTLGKRQEL